MVIHEAISRVIKMDIKIEGKRRKEENKEKRRGEIDEGSNKDFKERIKVGRMCSFPRQGKDKESQVGNPLDRNAYDSKWRETLYRRYGDR